MLKFICVNNINYFTNIMSIRLGVSNVIDGYCDTGCTYTSIGLYSLARLLNIPIKDLKSYLEQRISKGYKLTRTSIANGMVMRAVPVRVYNVSIGGMQFKYLNCLVNIDDVLVETNGYQTDAIGACYKVSPYMLVGLDILRAFSRNIMDKDEIMCNNFDEEFYSAIWDNIEGIITLYMDMPLGNINT